MLSCLLWKYIQDIVMVTIRDSLLRIVKNKETSYQKYCSACVLTTVKGICSKNCSTWNQNRVCTCGTLIVTPEMRTAWYIYIYKPTLEIGTHNAIQHKCYQMPTCYKPLPDVNTYVPAWSECGICLATQWSDREHNLVYTCPASQTDWRRSGDNKSGWLHT